MKYSPYDPENVQKQLSQLEGMTGSPHFQTSQHQECQVELKPDPKLAPALFKKHSLVDNIYYAHPDTIFAVRKDIFAAGEEDIFIDLEEWIHCEGCKQKLDLQFWQRCPYCLGKLPEISPEKII